jgi:hypothetical protein
MLLLLLLLSSSTVADTLALACTYNGGLSPLKVVQSPENGCHRANARASREYPALCRDKGHTTEEGRGCQSRLVSGMDCLLTFVEWLCMRLQLARSTSHQKLSGRSSYEHSSCARACKLAFDSCR